MQKGKELERNITKRHVFGVKADVYGSVHWLDDNTLTYPVGRNVVIHNVQSNSQKFFPTTEKTDAITAIALSPNKKYIAIAESGEHPQIQIVDTNTRKRRRILNVTDLGSDRFVCMQFSGDGRHLVTQGGPPEWNLLYWNWERSKPLARIAVSREQSVSQTRDTSYSVVTQVSINPRDALHICVSGNGLFRFYRYVDGLLKVAPGGLGKAHTQHFTAHCWLNDDRIIVATDNADLLLIEDSEFRCPLPVAPSDNHSILTIMPYAKGFVCGGEYGLLNIFEQSDDKDLYRKVKTLNYEGPKKDGNQQGAEDKKSSIKCLALTHAEETLAMVTSSLQILAINFNQDWSKVEHAVFNPIAQPFHAGPIVGLDTCVRKPLVATSSTDRTVRIWNILEHTVEVIKSFPTEPGAIALHPSGLHILVCFHDRVRFMNLYGDDIREFKVFIIRSVSDVKFSVGGQFFAIVHGNIIQVYNTYTCEQTPTQLRGHSQKVRSIHWCSTSQFPTDNRLVSCSMDGAVLDWNLREGRKEGDHSDKRFSYHAVVSDDKTIWAVAAPSTSAAESRWKVKLREMEVANLHGDTVLNDYEFPDLYITTLQVATQHRLLFGGCADGSVKLMNFPLQGGIHEAPMLTHAGAITRMAISHDESMLFTVGVDGSFYIFDIREDGRSAKKETSYAEEILISRLDLEAKINEGIALKQQLEDLKLEMDYQEKRRQIQHDERLKELTDHFKEEAEKQQSLFEAVWNAKSDKERAFAEIKRDKMDEYRASCDELEKGKQAILQELEEQCNAHKVKRDEDRKRFNKELSDKRMKHEKEYKDAEEAHKEKLGAERDDFNKLQQQRHYDQQQQQETRSQLELDTDAEVENIKQRFDKALFQEREKYLHMKGENAIMKKNFITQAKEIDDKTQEIKGLDASKQKLTSTIRDLQANISQLRDDINDRDATIGEKEKKIYELKKRNQELEKYKFVLDHHIRELKSQIEPRLYDITQAKERIKKKDAELDRFHKNNLSLRGNIEELRQTISKQQHDIKTLSNRLKDAETYKSRVKTDVGELATMVQDPEMLKQGIQRVYDVHVVSRGGKTAPQLEPELKKEFKSQTEFLAKTVESLKRKVSVDADERKADISGIMVENLQLIKEINDLRKEIKALRNPPQMGKDGHPEKDQSLAQASQTQATDASISTAQAAMREEIENNRAEIARLRSKVDEMEKLLHSRQRGRPGSRENPLPPVS